jgi:hypothetical protein
MPAAAANCHGVGLKMWNGSYPAALAGMWIVDSGAVAPIGAMVHWYRNASIGTVLEARRAGR